MIDKSLNEFLGNTKKFIIESVFNGWLKLVNNIITTFAFTMLLVQLMDYTPEQSGDKQRLIVLVFVVFGTLVLRHYLIKAMNDASSKIVCEVKLNLRAKIIDKITRRGMAYKDDIATSEMLQLAGEGIEQLENYYGKYLPQLFYCLLSSFTLFAVVVSINVKIALVLLITTLAIPLFLTALLRMVRKVQRNYWSSYASVGKEFLDSLQGMTTLKIFMYDEQKGQILEEKTEDFRKHTMKLLAMQLNSIGIIDWIAYGGAAAGIIMALRAYQAGTINLFGAILVVLIAGEFFVPMKQLTAFFHIAMTGVTAAEKITKFINVPDYKSGDKEVPENCDIKIENLNYTYKNSEFSLNDINMELENKGHIAIVGPSGCGKSTISNIIAGELVIEAGNVFYQNDKERVDMTDVKRQLIPEMITKVTHNGYIFKGTVRENLLLGNEKASDEMLLEALEKVNILGELPEGLDTELLSGGSNVSGGQGQRLCLARAILHDTPVYIFDEATSNIDVESEEIILKVIEEISKDKTVIYISHRLKNIDYSKCIYVMENGKIVDKGNHNELVERKGLYYKLFKKQEDLEKYRFGREA